MSEWQQDLDLLFDPREAPRGDAVDEPAEKQPRLRRRRPRPGKPGRRKLSARALAARRANLQKARAAPRERIYRWTKKRRAASRANLRKAQAARRTRRGNASARLNALKHGLYATAHPRASVRRLGERPGEFAAHRRRFERLFVPEDDEETRIVQRLADACWRRLRFFRAAARWEAGRLKQILARAPRRPRLDVMDTEDRARALVLALSTTYDTMELESNKLNSGIEAQLRALLRKRSGGAIEFRFFSPRRDPGSRTGARGLYDDDDGLLWGDDETGISESEFKELEREFQFLPLEVQEKLLHHLREDKR